MKRIISILLGICLAFPSLAERQDSLRVERWLEEALTLPEDSCRTLHFARQMLGIPYVAGTLDDNDCEQLVVHTDKADCTTFVETVLALTLADKEDRRSFTAFKSALTHIRYRGGLLDGYASRLHYFSDWIRDNERKGYLKECTCETPSACPQTLQLNFMSTHPDSYLPMKKDTTLIRQIALLEKQWQGVEVCYIPKENLSSSPDKLNIKNGDILALTTHIKGLDIVHVGFAVWIGEKLHLLHASSVAGKVIIDPLSLYEYSKNKKAHTGVRVVRIL